MNSAIMLARPTRLLRLPLRLSREPALTRIGAMEEAVDLLNAKSALS
jgi:hypothetical protein